MNEAIQQVNGSKPERTAADMAARTIRVIPAAIANDPLLRSKLPADADPKLMDAVACGVAARMVADLVMMSLPPQHALHGAAMEYVAMSMGMLCHYSGCDAEVVSRTANELMEVLSTPNPGNDCMGHPGIITPGSSTPQ